MHSIIRTGGASARVHRLLPSSVIIQTNLARHSRAFAQHVDYGLFPPSLRPPNTNRSTTSEREPTPTLVAKPNSTTTDHVEDPEQTEQTTVPQPRKTPIDIDAHVLKEFYRLVLEPSIFREEFLSVRPDASSQPESRTIIPSLNHLLAEYDLHAGHVLNRVLPGESTPPAHRRLTFDDDADDGRIRSSTSSTRHDSDIVEEDGPIVLIAHITVNMAEQVEKIAICSGFFIQSDNLPSGGHAETTYGPGESLPSSSPILVSCAHTMEEVCVVSVRYMKRAFLLKFSE